MARQPALNEEALVKLGSEKLARLVIGEAKRNAAFRKLVAAALAATKGPAAVSYRRAIFASLCTRGFMA